jgi:hypothetical protein
VFAGSTAFVRPAWSPASGFSAAAGNVRGLATVAVARHVALALSCSAPAWWALAANGHPPFIESSSTCAGPTFASPCLVGPLAKGTFVCHLAAPAAGLTRCVELGHRPPTLAAGDWRAVRLLLLTTLRFATCGNLCAGGTKTLPPVGDATAHDQLGTGFSLHLGGVHTGVSTVTPAAITPTLAAFFWIAGVVAVVLIHGVCLFQSGWPGPGCAPWLLLLLACTCLAKLVLSRLKKGY